MKQDKKSGASWLHWGGWLLGLLALLALVGAVLHFGELEQFTRLARQARPAWLLAALLLQALTYISAAAVWYVALAQCRQRQPFTSLISLGLAKVFADQALPSGSASGSILVVNIMKTRGVPEDISMSALLTGLLSYYLAFLLAALASLGILLATHRTNHWILTAIGAFAVIAAGLPLLVLWIRRHGEQVVPRLTKRIPSLWRLLHQIHCAPLHLFSSPRLAAQTISCQFLVFALDAATLWVMLRAIGYTAPPVIVFPCLVMATVAATIGIIPLGLGTFEGVCIGMLRLFGVPLAFAFAATLLLRGFTLWLPMLPGLWLAKKCTPASADAKT
jgi:uncharacterized protein (TIRG00374 family)